MSARHPIIAVTESSGACTSTVREASEHIFANIGINLMAIEGDSIHKFTRIEMSERIKFQIYFVIA